MAMQSGFIKRIRDIMRMDAGINGDGAVALTENNR